MFFYHSYDRLYGLYVFLDISGVALFVVGWRGGFSSLSFPAMTGTVGICLSGGFRSYSSFADLFGYFSPLKNLVGLLVGLPFDLPSILIGLLCPVVINSV